MNFELVGYKVTGLPITKDGQYGIPMNAFAGVVGNPYTSAPSFTAVIETFCPLLISDGEDKVLPKMAAWGAAKVAEKYPNI